MLWRCKKYITIDILEKSMLAIKIRIKMVSRISIISAELFLMGQILKYTINAKLYMGVSFVSIFFYILCVLLIVQAVLFYKAFFRFKKNYKEVSPEEIRMFHLKCA